MRDESAAFENFTQFTPPFVVRKTPVFLPTPIPVLAFVKAILGISVVLFLSTVVCKTEVGLKKVFLKTGVYSAAIYLLHTFTMAIFRLPAEKYIGYTPVSFYSIGLLSVVGGTILAMLLTKYVIQKWKSLKFLLLGE